MERLLDASQPRPHLDEGLFARLHHALLAPRDIAALAVFRMALGLIALVSALRFLAYGWITELYTRPTVRFSYWGFEWLPVASSAVTHALFVALALLGTLVALGLLYRAAVGALFLVFTYLQLVDVATYLNHYYLVSLLAGLMFFIPAHRAWSLDARLLPGVRAETAPAWCTYLLRFQIAVVYLNAGLAKATGDWLLHAQPLGIWLSARTDLPLVGPFLDLPIAAYVASWAGFLFDTTIAFWLLWRRTRPFAYLAVLAFHLGTHLLFPMIGMFPVIMVVAALVFFDSSWPRRLGAGLARVTHGWRKLGVAARSSSPIDPAGPRASSPPALAMGGAPSRWFGAGAMAASFFLVVQVLLPLRAHLYGGNVLWHEQGMRFSWRVMSRAKNGSVTFIARDPRSGREWRVSPHRYLTPMQEREMAVQPDLILQLAHHIAWDFAQRGHPDLEVRADARASLNGRPAERLVDPTVDLAHVPDRISGNTWITPGPTVEPPHLRSLHADSRSL